MNIRTLRYKIKDVPGDISRDPEEVYVGLDVDDVERSFPELLKIVPAYNMKYIKTSMVLSLLLEKIQLHKDELEDWHIKQEERQATINELNKRVEELMALIG
jgi:hypothetical protein